MSDFDDLKALSSRPEITVSLCLDGRLFGERDRLRTELANSVPTDSLAADPVAAAILVKINALDEKGKAATRDFTLQALPRARFRELEDAYPPNTKTGEFGKDFLANLAVECLTAPALTIEQYVELDLSAGQCAVIEDAAWAVNRATGTLPF